MIATLYCSAFYSAVLVSGVLGHMAIAQWTSDAMLGISRTATTVRAEKPCEGVEVIFLVFNEPIFWGEVDLFRRWGEMFTQIEMFLG